ncbi:hypothetical protein [Bacillus solimangrovi]|uniref:Nucleotidase n=1 Tax=Bacillus solimangrovi TaxID=1305675 RepID=A0A1E5LI39_9BACI|nr:hypothetical protein [Bacillus solimangrovi]OEH93728.1 hypothetical protein BFG57_11875 [Bacillus solimangrovi]
MNGLRMGIDIDGTVTCPSTFVPYLNKDFNKSLTLDDITEYNLVPVLQEPPERIAKWFEENEHYIYSHSPLAEGALQVLHEWEHTHEFFFISARGDYLLDITKDWFNRHHINFDHIELIGQHDKIAATKQHNVEIFFEDKHDNAVDISEACNIPVILFDTPYNRSPIPKNVIRVSNWGEAKYRVNQLFKGENS